MPRHHSKTSITADELRQVIRYEPETGLFFWTGKPRVGVTEGKRAGNYDKKSRYRRIRIWNIEYKAHRLAWLYVHGVWPGDVDHINGDPSDNRLCNLRESSPSQNLANQKKRVDNSTGFKGVARRSNASGYRAHLCGQYLGSFATAEDAHEAYQQAALARFGEFARFE